MAGLAVHAKKMAGSRHPVVRSVRDMVVGPSGAKSDSQLHGLVVLLMAKTLSASNSPVASVEPISAKQRALAEITELINSAMNIHTGVLDLSDPSTSGAVAGDLLLGNKVVYSSLLPPCPSAPLPPIPLSPPNAGTWVRALFEPSQVWPLLSFHRGPAAPLTC